MPVAKCSDEEFIELYQTMGAEGIARQIGVTAPNVYKRRRRLEQKYGKSIYGPNTKPNGYKEIPSRARMDVGTGNVIIFSDAHFWPGLISTSYRALLKATAFLKPAAIIANGDVFDGAGVSRHPPIGWARPPSVLEELETCKENMGEIQSVAPDGCRLLWTKGNHDSRFENRLASQAPEFAGVSGFQLDDHFPDWEFSWSVWINDDVVVKHRYKGGIHATHNNTMWSGKTMVTGHLHSQKSTPLTDYNGTRWGVDSGTLAAVTGPQFIDYLEDNPVNWREGFAVLSFVDGTLLQPEFVRVVEQGTVDFRGKLWNVE